MKTYHDGAADERTDILAKVRRLIKRPGKDPLATLRDWLLARHARYVKRKGGL